jgi:hypothetical protein
MSIRSRVYSIFLDTILLIYTWWPVQIKNLFVTQFSWASCYFLSSRTKHSLQQAYFTRISNVLNLRSSLWTPCGSRGHEYFWTPPSIQSRIQNT